MGSTENRWSEETLKEAWNQMFNYSYYQNHYESIDVQNVIVIMEAGLTHVKRLATAYSALRASEKELVAQLESKTVECSSLKDQLDRLPTNCDKCEILEMSLVNAKKKAKEAQARMDSIANILKLGEHSESTQGAVRSAALDMVSQMILASSPSPKKRKKSDVNEKSVLVEKNDFENRSPSPNLLPGVPQLPPSTISSKVVKSPIIDVKRMTSRKSPSGKNALSISIKKTSSKRDIFSNFENDSEKNVNCSKSLNGNKIPVEGEIQQKLDKSTIDSSLNDEQPTKEREKSNISNQSMSRDETISSNESISDQVIEETPANKKRKADFWIMKEKRGLGEISRNSGRRIRQMKLKLGTKKFEKKIDLSKIGDSSKSDIIAKDSEDIIVLSPELEERPVLARFLPSEVDEEISSFKPMVTSTQKLPVDHPGESSKRPVALSTFDRLPVKETTKEPEYVYERDAVRKKADRKKLEGWECKECVGFYSVMGKQMNSAELKKCMNDCSKHRNKFRPKLNDTPQEFWNPLLDNQDVKGYTSFYENRD